jgi:signal transduction histidine kinase
MSLHGKVIAWFALFASVLVTLFVLGDYYQSTRALRIALEARAEALARQAATDIERRYESAEVELRELGHAVAGGVSARPASLDDYAAILVFRDGTLVTQMAGAAERVSPGACAPASVPFLIEFVDAAGHQYRVEASMPGTRFFSSISSVSARIGHTGATSVLRSADGSLLFDHGCGIRAGEVPLDLEAGIGEHVRAPENADRSAWIAEVMPEKDRPYPVAIVRAKHPEWSVAVALDHAAWAAPFVVARTQYLAIMIVIMIATLLFTLRMIRNDMQRLTAISRAADAIGLGRLDVWLPPPTGDEVGRLSLALGQMVNRLGSTMRQLEINAGMAAVGEMATYLSHEIRNPLSSIRLNLQMLQRDLRTGTAPADGEEMVGLCLTEMQRLNDVVNTVLDMGRKTRQQQGVCDAHEVVNDTVLVMKEKFASRGVEVETRFGALDSDVGMDAAKLKSVLINLLLNSVDAVAHAAEKRITVTTEQLELPEGTHLELRVLDSGPGVPPHLETQIFEPFFTTKTTGSGIGLATALRIVKECGGSLRCTVADEGHPGGEFIMDLPLTQATPRLSRPAAMAAVG